MPEREATLR